MSSREYILLMVGMGLVTYLPRTLPLVLLARRRLPDWLAEWLELIPVAILAALLAPTLFASAEPRVLVLGKREFWAALPALLIALKTRSLAGTVLTGMLGYWLLTLII